MSQYTLHEATGLTADDLDNDPITQLQRWIAEAKAADHIEPTAACLATADADGRPSARMVLVRGVGPQGVAVYTNHDSQKGREMAANPHAAVCLWWSGLQRQVRIEGPVTRMPQDEAERYYRTRPRGSRIGAWASAQSAPIDDRQDLATAFNDFEARFPDDDIPLPDYWGGYWIGVASMEFWQGRDNRLHDRLRYDPDGDGWHLTRLQP